MQEFLVAPDSLVFSWLASHEKLAAMSIHTAIRQRRKALALSMQALADKVSRLEGLPKPLGYQAVQQWEKEEERGGTAPKRTRLPYVAQALQTTVKDLVSGNGGPPAPGVLNAPPPPPAGFQDRLQVSESDFGVLLDVKLVMTEKELADLRDRAERTRAIALQQWEAVKSRSD